MEFKSGDLFLKEAFLGSKKMREVIREETRSLWRLKHLRAEPPPVSEPLSYKGMWSKGHTTLYVTAH